MSKFCLRPRSYIPAVGLTGEVALAAEATPEAAVWDAGDERKYEVNVYSEEKKRNYRKKNCTNFFCLYIYSI